MPGMRVHPSLPCFLKGGCGLKSTGECLQLLEVIFPRELIIFPQFSDARDHDRRRCPSSSTGCAQAALDDSVLDPRGLASQLLLHTEVQRGILFDVVVEEPFDTEVDVTTLISTAMQ